ncbi:MAG: SUMF1/EgtB/PvdO family nonheme iron enzyme, partial [Alphaproteobacteria bacterium]|nr:SUMF1/EgtB/PvdO family nonheme iron enzyme [Alphaproteobacteria bacterium]
MKPLTAIAGLVVAAALTPAPAPAAEPNKDAVAVIIGNRNYQGDIPAVDYAHNDAEAMKRFVMEALGFRTGNIIDLRDASQAELYTTFGNRDDPEGRLWGWVREGRSDVVVFYSGHGVPGQKDGRGYLLPVDADPETPEINGYPVDLLYENLSRLPARSITVFLDACFSGDSAGGTLCRGCSAIAVVPKLPKAAGKLTVLTAAGADQIASWDQGAEHGLFTLHLLRALRGAADGKDHGNGDGRVTLAEVKAYLDDEMTYAARRQFRRRQQATVQGTDDTVLARLAPPPPQPPGPEIVAVDETLYVGGRGPLNVRSAPGTQGTKVIGGLAPGSAVTVTGRVKNPVDDLPWARIALADGGAGFVWSAPLTATPPASEENRNVGDGADDGGSGGAGLSGPSKPRPPASKDPYQVVLASGITLGDWVMLAEDRLKAGDFAGLIAEGDKYRRQHGAYPELVTVLHAAVLGDVRRLKGLEKARRAAAYQRRFGAVPGLDHELEAAVSAVLEQQVISDKTSARRALNRLASLQEISGPTLPIFERRALAHHVLGAYADAEAAYRGWLGRAPRDHPDRKRMALGLFKAQQEGPLFPPPGTTFKDCGDCPEMVVVPAGPFNMGSNRGADDEKPIHRVTIPAPLAVGKYEVTFAQWDACVSAGGCGGHRPNDQGWGRGNRPVINVSWENATAYVAWLSDKTGKSYRLLSEAEWEYVARAGTTTRYWWGDKPPVCRAGAANGAKFDDDQACDDTGTEPVGTYRPNAFGLYDVHGNVWEWVEDCWHGNYRDAPTDGNAWTTGGECGRRVLRGGSWFNGPRYLRSAVRSRFRAEYRINSIV